MIGGSVFKRDGVETPEGLKKLALVEFGGFLLELIEPPAGTLVPSGEGSIPHFAVYVNDLDKTAADLKAAGVISFTAPEKKVLPNTFGGLQNWFFTGPSGEQIELLQMLSKNEHLPSVSMGGDFLCSPPYGNYLIRSLKMKQHTNKKRNHHTNSQFSLIQPSSDKKAPNLTVGSFRKPKASLSRAINSGEPRTGDPRLPCVQPELPAWWKLQLRLHATSSRNLRTWSSAEPSCRSGWKRSAS